VLLPHWLAWSWLPRTPPSPDDVRIDTPRAANAIKPAQAFRASAAEMSSSFHPYKLESTLGACASEAR
jgi:hypothetical protein